MYLYITDYDFLHVSQDRNAQKIVFIGLYVAYANLQDPKDLGDSYCEDFDHHIHPRFGLKCPNVFIREFL